MIDGAVVPRCYVVENSTCVVVVPFVGNPSHDLEHTFNSQEVNSFLPFLTIKIALSAYGYIVTIVVVLSI